MTKDLFSDAVTQIGSDLVERFCSMDERLERKKTNRRIYLKWSAAAACLLLAIGMTFVLKDLNALPVDIDSIAWCTQDTENVPSIEYSPWNGWNINYALYSKLTDKTDDSYIAIRVVQKDLASTDLQNFNIENILEYELQKFEDAGVCAVVKNQRLFIFVTREQLKTLSIDGKECYTLMFAKRRSYEHKAGDIPTLDHNTTGFAYEKFSFEIAGSYYTPDCDRALIDTINQLIGAGQFDTDRISFHIQSDEILSEDVFADMHCESLYIAKYIKSCYGSVLYENINLESLKALSNHPSVSSITVYLDIVECEPA